MTDFEQRLYIAKEGFAFAKLHRDGWFSGVNRCPYGPGIPGNLRAQAWYEGWWFFFYTVKPWADLIGGKHGT